MKRKILAIPGSTKKQSSHLVIIQLIQSWFENDMDITIYDGIGTLPHFNPDLDNESPPGAVSEFRQQLRDADGILICTPEYAMGVPGSLKNALDWTVSSAEFYQKPVALITASSVGAKGHQALLETLTIIGSEIPESSRLLISSIKTKVKDQGIVDAFTQDHVKALAASLLRTIGASKQAL